jgi:hypothetical protein
MKPLEFKNTIKCIEQNLTSPGTSLASEEPTNHVKARHLLFEGPLALCSAMRFGEGI